MKPTKKKFEEYLNKKSASGSSLKSMTSVEMTYPLTKVNIRSNIRGNFGTLLRRHNPTEFNKRYKTFKFIKEQDPHHSNIKLAPGIIKMLDKYDKLRAKGLTHREASDKIKKKMF